VNMSDVRDDFTPGSPTSFLESHAEDGREPPLSINLGVNTLLPELTRIEQAERSCQIEEDGSYSHSFLEDLWIDFKEYYDLSAHGVSGDDLNPQIQRFNEVMEATNQLKSTIALLDALKSEAQNVLITAKLKLKCAGHGFGRLPLELLAETMCFACEDPYDLIHLSHVNRRLRNVALSMTDIWSHISSAMPTELLRLCLERSKRAPLHLVFYEMSNNPGLKTKTCIVETAQCCSRWKDVKLYMPSSDHNDFTHESYMLYRDLSTNFFRGIHVPRLVSFSLSHHGHIPVARDNSSNSRTQLIETIHFYHSWQAPNLHTISFYGIVPAPIHGASVQELSLKLPAGRGIYYMDFFVALKDLLVFMQETPSLQKLEIDTCSNGVTRSIQVNDFPTLTLENLKDLTLKVGYSKPNANGDFPFSKFVACLRIPNLSTLAVKLSTVNHEETQIWDATNIVNKFIPQLGTATSLSNLSLFAHDSWQEFHGSSSMMSVALNKYPSLRTLTLGICGRLYVSPGSTLHPNLKNRGLLEQINLLACEKGAEDFLAWVVGEFRSGDGDGLKNLKKVVIRECGSTNEREILKCIPSEKLEFKRVRYRKRARI